MTGRLTSILYMHRYEKLLSELLFCLSQESKQAFRNVSQCPGQTSDSKHKMVLHVRQLRLAQFLHRKPEIHVCSWTLFGMWKLELSLMPIKTIDVVPLGGMKVCNEHSCVYVYYMRCLYLTYDTYKIYYHIYSFHISKL